MNIAQAKEEIEAALDFYHRKDEDGMYVYPLVHQRPILLIGPPGIGKTAIMEQIAREKHVGLVSYTMTHHTRQSAIGLPKILQKDYDGEKVNVTEYTLSEIIASVYDCMERTGYREGILFIDEINCVSETLAPVMLQFLQNKMFGSHHVPEGWMIVAAGNPPQYNKSVREFDIVTLDRVRRIEVEADEESWAAYASAAGVHGAILSWLKMKPDHFYMVCLEDGEKRFVTARGWEDLSWFLKSSEQAARSVTKEQIGEFLQDASSAAEFYTFYRVWLRHGEDYQVPRLLDGTAGADLWKEKQETAARAPLEEQLVVTGQMVDVLRTQCGCWQETQKWLQMLRDEQAKVARLPENADGPAAGAASISGSQPATGNVSLTQAGLTDTALARYIRQKEQTLRIQRRENLLSQEQERLTGRTISLLRQVDEKCRAQGRVRTSQAEEVMKEKTGQIRAGQEQLSGQIQQMIHNAITFCRETYEGDAQMRLLLFEMAGTEQISAFLTQYPDDLYLRECGRFMA